MPTAGNTVRVGWTYSICVRVRKIAFPWKLTKGTREMHVCSAHPPSTLTDHNMKTQPIALSLSFTSNFSSCLHMSGPSVFSPAHLLFWSFHLTLSGPHLSNSLCLFPCVFTRQGQKKIVGNGLWRNFPWKERRDRAVTALICYLHCFWWSWCWAIGQSLIMFLKQNC